MVSELAEKLFSLTVLKLAFILFGVTIAMLVVIPLFPIVSDNYVQSVLTPLTDDMNKQVMDALNKLN
ncbi:single tm domain protein [Entamoeba histolytica]|uniref:Single tm domain protein n=1 Tax=Entamoeba histolytica TaxID=5759 RepID=A0A175JXS9_ENTHI|nr:single tm domain protein [Entamoeba histolytica]